MFHVGSLICGVLLQCNVGHHNNGQSNEQLWLFANRWWPPHICTYTSYIYTAQLHAGIAHTLGLHPRLLLLLFTNMYSHIIEPIYRRCKGHFCPWSVKGSFQTNKQNFACITSSKTPSRNKKLLLRPIVVTGITKVGHPTSIDSKLQFLSLQQGATRWPDPWFTEEFSQFYLRTKEKHADLILGSLKNLEYQLLLNTVRPSQPPQNKKNITSRQYISSLFKCPENMVGHVLCTVDNQSSSMYKKNNHNVRRQQYRELSRKNATRKKPRWQRRQRGMLSTVWRRRSQLTSEPAKHTLGSKLF